MTLWQGLSVFAGFCGLWSVFMTVQNAALLKENERRINRLYDRLIDHNKGRIEAGDRFRRETK